MRQFHFPFMLLLLFLLYITQTMHKQDYKVTKPACPSGKSDEEQAQSFSIPFDLLTINDHKNSIDLSEGVSCDKQHESCYELGNNAPYTLDKKQGSFQKKGKMIHKRDKERQDQKRVHLNRKRRIVYLENRVQQLEQQVNALKRQTHYCLNCRHRSPDYYRERISEIILPQEATPSVAGPLQKNPSIEGHEGWLQFEKIDFHGPLMQTQEMQEKMWIFLGTMLIAMGSKVMDFDGTINNFKVLKNSVDRVRRQVEKGQTLLGMNFFCSKEEMHEPGSLIDGMNFDPFYTCKEDPTAGHFSLQGVKMESVEEYQLFYDCKYDFNIKYDALLTIMEYARDNCTLS